MTVLFQKLHSLAQLTGKKLVIEADGGDVSIGIGDSVFYCSTIDTEILATALLHLSLGAKLEKDEEEKAD